jgi:exopolysaccharide production protein ExoY
MERTVAVDSESPFAKKLTWGVDRLIETIGIDGSPSDRSLSIEARATDSHRSSHAQRSDHGAPAVYDADRRLSADRAVQSSVHEPLGGSIKRIFDVIASLTAIVFLSPLIALVCVAVYVEGQGPVLFRQRRIGFKSQEFTCLKFRTMAVDAQDILQEYLANDDDARREWQLSRKLRNDPRITTLGRFLRRSSIDELPQLFNVLVGHMSIVGPRPIVADEVALYREHFCDYTTARPGLTGLWQISGRNTTSYPQRVAYDVEYVRNWSLTGDVRIMCATIMHIWEGEGAY